MNVKIWVLLLCCCALPSGAFARGPKKSLVRAARKAAQSAPAAKTADEAFVRTLTKRAADAWAAHAAGSVGVIRPTPADELRSFLPVFNAAQLRRERSRYYRAMRAFGDLKRTLDVHLFYRRANHERMNPTEQAYYIRLIAETEDELACCALVFHDKPLQAARMYLLDVRHKLDPFFTPEGLSAPRHLHRTDRKFDLREFFLYDARNRPAQTKSYFWPGEWKELRRARELSAALPENMNIAFVNDFLPTLTAVNEWKKKGVFGPGRRVMTFQSGDELLRFIGHGYRVDLVVTDLIMANGGGYYLTSELRSRGLQMPILALSSFGESEVRAKELFHMGFDGMLSTRATGGFPLNSEGYLTLLTALNNYYYWKNLHGWER